MRFLREAEEDFEEKTQEVEENEYEDDAEAEADYEDVLNSKKSGKKEKTDAAELEKEYAKKFGPGHSADAYAAANKDLDYNKLQQKRIKDLIDIRPDSDMFKQTATLKPEAQKEILRLVCVAKNGDIDHPTHLWGRAEQVGDDNPRKISDKAIKSAYDKMMEEAEDEVDNKYIASRGPWLVEVPKIDEAPSKAESLKAFNTLVEIYLPYATAIAIKTANKLHNFNAGKLKKVDDFEKGYTPTTQELRDKAKQAVGKGIANVALSELVEEAMQEAYWGIGIGVDRFYANSPTYKNNVTKCIGYAVRQTIEDRLMKFYLPTAGVDDNGKPIYVQIDSFDASVGQDAEGNELTLGDTLANDEVFDTEHSAMASREVQDLLDKIEERKEIGLTEAESDVLRIWASDDRAGKNKVDNEYLAQQAGIADKNNAGNYLRWGIAKLNLWKLFHKSAAAIGAEIGSKKGARGAAIAYITFKKLNGDNAEPESVDELAQYLGVKGATLQKKADIENTTEETPEEN